MQVLSVRPFFNARRGASIFTQGLIGRLHIRAPRRTALHLVPLVPLSGTRKMSGKGSYAFRDTSLNNTYNYGDAAYWDNRYLQEAGSFDWYQRYVDLKPFIEKYVPKTSRILMVGCGNAVMSEDMVRDGYQEIMNIDISAVAIQMMQNKYERVPQLKYVQMDVRNMSSFANEYFDSVIDKGTLDSLMCGASAPISAARMLEEVSRVLKPGGVYMLITYGDPRVRMPHLNQPRYNWTINLYIIPRPGFETPEGSSSKSYMEPVPLTEDGLPTRMAVDASLHH